MRASTDRAPSAPRSVQTSDDGRAFDLPVLVRLQECFVVLERHASVRIAVGAEHVAVGEQARPPEEVAAADGFQAQRLNSMERLLARLEFIDVGRRRTAVSFVEMTR